MTEPVDWQPADMTEMVEMAERHLAESENQEQLRVQLAGKVNDLQGPLGELLRTICVMYADWVDANEIRCVTEAESIRMEKIMDSAVVFEAWLRCDS